MVAEMAHALDVCEAEVMAFIEPLEQVRGPLFSSFLCTASLLVFSSPADACCGVKTLEQRCLPLPCPQLTAAEVRRLEAAEADRQRLLGSLDALKQRVANVE